MRSLIALQDTPNPALWPLLWTEGYLCFGKGLRVFALPKQLFSVNVNKIQDQEQELLKLTFVFSEACL